MVDGYTLLDVLGAGAVGTVHRAEDRSHPGRIVALKHVPGGRVARTAIEREVAALERLAHPSIVRVLDVVEDADGAALVTAYLSGGSLAARIATRGPLPAEEVADLGARVGGALASAHDAGVVHRDVKPSNVLYDAEEQPLVADFGAALLDRGSDGWVVGSATYLDPAVAVDGASPDARSDQYGLAVTLYEALAGVPPYAAPTVEATLRAADRGLHVPLVDQAPHAPPELCAAIERGLARAPEQRFATVRELATHLAAVGTRLLAGADAPAPIWRPHSTTSAPPPVADPGPGVDAGPPPPPAATSEPTDAWASLTSAPTGETASPQATTRFGPAPPPRSSLAGATAEPPRRRAWWLVAAVAVVVLPLVVVAALVWGPGRSSPIGDDGVQPIGGGGDAEPTDDPRPELPRCDDAPPPPGDGEVREADLEGTGCTVPLSWDTDQRVLTVPADDGPARFQLGEPGDVLLIGAWECDGRDAPALYRPATGQVFTFGRFGDPGGELESQPARDTEVVDGDARVARDADGCDRVEVEPG